MLKLDSLTAFTGVIDNFTGNGSLSGSDQIDLKGINFSSVHDSYSNGILTVTDGTDTTTLDFNGAYVLANFKFASDGSGGTIVYDPPVPAQPSAIGQTANNIFADVRHDLFVFASDPAPPTFTPTMSNVPFNSTASPIATPLDRNAPGCAWRRHHSRCRACAMVGAPQRFSLYLSHTFRSSALHIHVDDALERRERDRKRPSDPDFCAN